MLFNSYKLKIKELFHNKSTMFFSLIFPIILTTLFYMTLTAFDNGGNLKTIPIAIENHEISNVLQQIEDDNGNKLFKIIKSDNYQKDLKSKKITAYISGKSKLKVTVVDNDIYSSLVFETVNMYNHISSLYGKVMSEDLFMDIDKIQDIYEQENNIENKFDTSNKNVSMTYFIALLAMTCLSASSQGVDVGEILNKKSDMEYVKRILISPISKFKIIFAHFLGALTFSLFVSIITILYFLLLKIPIVDQLWKVLIIMVLGTILGLFQGVFISTALNIKLTTKYNLNAIIYVFSSFLAGLMSYEIPYMLSEKFPFIKYINPATIITETLKSLYYFENMEKFVFGLVNMTMLILFFTLLILFINRRKKHENI